MMLPKSSSVKLYAFYRPVLPFYRNRSKSEEYLNHKYNRSSAIREIRQRLQRNEEEETTRLKLLNPERELLSEVESIASIMMLKQNESKYPSFAKKMEDIQQKIKEKMETIKAKQSSADLNFPLNAEKKTEIFEKAKTESEKNLSHDVKKIVLDSGFFVRGDHLYEEYESASAIELPESEMNELPFTFHGYDNDPVEEVQLVYPGQKLRSVQDNPKPHWKTKRSKAFKEERKRTEEENLGETGIEHENYGAEDQSIPPSKNAKCSGCGAFFQCNNSSLPGFVPFNMFDEIELNARKRPERQKSDFMCRRCYLQKEYNFLLNVNVCPVDYHALMGHLKLMQEALILLVVDMADLECSIHQELPKIIGDQKPMIVVGNKIDLLPPDAEPGYLKRYQDALRMAVYKAGFSDRFNILKYSLISAKTGYGVEDLVTQIYANWVGPRNNLRSNVYMVGCTNAGKSTLFNTFLRSDLCMVRAMDLVERVTTSIWPGTTMSLLKFPMWNPTPYKMELRKQKLIEFGKWRRSEKILSEELYKMTKDPKHLVLQGYVGNTFKEAEEESQPVNLHQVRQEFYGEEDPEEEKQLRLSKLNLNDPVFQAGTNWCHDTPGTVNKQQVLDVFTLEELINVVPRQLLVPRTFLVRAGKSLLIGGVARVDVISAMDNRGQKEYVLMSVLASDKLKVQCFNTLDVDGYLERNLGDIDLGAPIGDAERLAVFPKLEAQFFDIEMQECSRLKASADVVLSSIGWVAVTSMASFLQVVAWTPSGRGLQVRSPPIMPYVSQLRGDRIDGTYTYKTRLNSKVEESIYLRGDRTKKYKSEFADNDCLDQGVSFDLGID